MKAAVIERYGDTSVFKIKDMPDPTLKKQEVLVKIAAASINPVDWKLRKGMLKYLIPLRFPVILGYDFCGEVVKADTTVTKFKVGDRVLGRSSYLSGRCYAEFIAANENTIALKPANISDVEGASIPLAALTALQCIEAHGKIRPGNHVMIIGASGGVGTFAVQLAKILGATVTAVCSTANVDFVKSLGADLVIDYKTEPLFKAGDHYHLIYDAVAQHEFNLVRPYLTEAGRYVTTVPTVANLPSFVTTLFSKQKSIVMVVKNKIEDLDFILKNVSSGKIKTVIDSTFSLDEVSKAHERSETGRARGKIVLKIG